MPSKPTATQAEVEFINKLGKWSGQTYERQELLQDYYQALRQRKDWDGIDKDVVTQLILNHLKKL